MSQKIETVERPWSKGIIMICTKCGLKLGSEEISHNLKKELKTLAQNEGFEKNLRVVTSSCLDICPDDRITVAFATEGKIKTVTVEQNVDPKELFEELVEKR